MDNTFTPNLTIGDTISHRQLVDIFEVSYSGGMRRSKKNNSLVLICNHTEGLYDDRWDNDVLYYTGMGQTGDQTLEGNQNKTLFESRTNGIEVYLFEVLVPAEYLYQGLVELCEEPYQEQQFDKDGNERKVWVFPIRSKTAFAAVEKEEFERATKSKTEEAAQMAFDRLRIKAVENQTEKPSNRNTITKSYLRDPYIARYARLRANGRCQLCGKEAPFLDLHGDPYLESHHIIWLSRGGADTIDNTVGLCPNCHRKMHVLDRDIDKKKLILINHRPKRFAAKHSN